MARFGIAFRSPVILAGLVSIVTLVSAPALAQSQPAEEPASGSPPEGAGATDSPPVASGGEAPAAPPAGETSSPDVPGAGPDSAATEPAGEATRAPPATDPGDAGEPVGGSAAPAPDHTRDTRPYGLDDALEYQLEPGEELEYPPPAPSSLESLPAEPSEAPVPDLPIQEVVPPAPDEETEPEEIASAHGYNRRTRFFDAATDLATRIARDGGFALRPVWGGLASDLIPRGVPAGFSGALGIELDGLPYEIPLAARGVDYKDLRLIPIAAIDSYDIEPGMRVGGFGGRVNLHTRRLHGADASIVIGDRDQRRISVAGGYDQDRGHATVGLDWRGGRGLVARSSEDLMTLLATAGYDVTEDFRVGVSFRFYRNQWDELGTMTAIPEPCGLGEGAACEPRYELGGGATDGGELRGTGASANLLWKPSDRTRVSAAFGFLEDRFNLYKTEAGRQHETRDFNRVAIAKAEASFEPVYDWLNEVGLVGEVGYDASQRRGFVDQERERVFQSDDLTGDWVKGGFAFHAELEPITDLVIAGAFGLDYMTVRRDEPRLGNEAQSASHIMPVYELDAAYDFGHFGIGLRVARENITNHEAFTGAMSLEASQPRIAWEGETGELRFFGHGELDDWVLGGGLAGFVGTYGRPALVDNYPGNAVYVAGVDLSVDVTHRPTDIALVARGGPVFTGMDGEPNFLMEAPGVPVYAIHVGLMRRVEEGLNAEVWVDAYGDYALPADGEAGSDHDELGRAQQDVSIRVGYRLPPVGIWLGINNLLDGEGASPPDEIIRRNGRAFYGMLELSL